MRLSGHYFIPVLIFVACYFIGKKKRRTIPCGQREDTGASRSSTSPERSDSEPSASSTSAIGNNYCVFLSFRGPDTRKGFVNHLSHRLRHEGLPFHPNFVFRDDENLRFGEPIAGNLISAIKHSKVSIPVISENYAASEWCLRELIHIMECKESRGQIVLPVLYKVKTEDVKRMQGKFGDAFKSSRHRFNEDVKQQGPEALKKALALRVYESEEFASGHEAELITELVRVIMAKQQHDVLPPLPGNLVGIDDRVAEVMKLADIDRSETRIIGICGFGGIGKTTLATNIYNKLSEKFECRSFLRDIRETINHKDMEYIQSLLISDITKNHESRVRDSVTGIGKIRSSCEKKKVLILLDDVGHGDHLNKLIGGCNFESGSRIIITCRDKTLLNSIQEFEYKSYELKEMNGKDSMLLFSLYALGAKQPPTELATLSRDIVATTGGLPLALMVIGSLLNGEKDPLVWKETREKLRNAPNKTVQGKLRISYETLEYKEQWMFLDIACFFIGTDKRIATYMWEDLKLFPITRLQVLINRSLIKIDGENRLTMHDLLRDLGRAIARPEDVEPWHWSRPWDVETMRILRRKEENEKIEALRLDKRGSRKFMKRESFKRMPNLKFLHLSAVDFAGDFEGSLSKLRWLKWDRCPNSFKATNVHLKKLVALDLSSNNISEKWRGWSSIKMERLKVLHLSRCFNLRNTPNLSAFKNLEMLILEQCVDLKEIDPSIGYVNCLVSLNLSDCKSLEKIPEELDKLENLEELVVDRTRIKEIPPCIGSLKKLKRLSAKSCFRLTEVPSSIIRLRLVNLSLANCYALQQIPSSIGKLGELVELDLSSTGIKELPEFIGELNKLKILRICCNSKIKRLPSSIGKLQSLQEFDADGCYELEGEIHVDKGGLSSLKTLCLRTTKISGLPKNVDQLSSLERLDLLNCRELQSLPRPPVSLSSLQLTCRSNELPSLSHLRHLMELTVHYCMSLQSIPELPSCIRTLDVWGCPKLERLPKLSDLEFLSELMLSDCDGLKELDGLEALKSLRRLNLSIKLDGSDERADELHAIRGVEKLGSLEVLNISGRKHIQVLDLSKSEHLKELIVDNCESLVEIRCPSKFLERFHRDGCESLKKLPNFWPPDEEFNYESDEEADEEADEVDEETDEEFNSESDEEADEEADEVDEESNVES